MQSIKIAYLLRFQLIYFVIRSRKMLLYDGTSAHTWCIIANHLDLSNLVEFDLQTQIIINIDTDMQSIGKVIKFIKTIYKFIYK